MELWLNRILLIIIVGAVIAAAVSITGCIPTRVQIDQPGQALADGMATVEQAFEDIADATDSTKATSAPSAAFADIRDIARFGKSTVQAMRPVTGDGSALPRTDATITQIGKAAADAMVKHDEQVTRTQAAIDGLREQIASKATTSAYVIIALLGIGAGLLSYVDPRRLPTLVGGWATSSGLMLAAVWVRHYWLAIAALGIALLAAGIAATLIIRYWRTYAIRRTAEIEQLRDTSATGTAADAVLKNMQSATDTQNVKIVKAENHI